MKKKIAPELLNKIRDAVNLIEVVGEHVVLRKSGANYTGLCPFHSERSPSFSVSEQKQLYHCYGCKRGGDLFAFVMELHGLGFPEAVEELSERARIPLPRDWTGAGDAGDDEETLKKKAAFREKTALAYKLNRFAAAFYHQSIPKQPHIASYFKSRGVEGELERNFYVGAAPVAWDALSAHLTAKKAPLELAHELGLIRPSPKRPGEYFDLFRNRAMFPILDLRGKVAGFGGRALPLPEGAPDVGGESPKYLNSVESFIFHKNKLAFGLFQAQKHIREKDTVILVEGYFDVLALHAAGFSNAVATCGTSLTPEHLNLFRRLGNKVIVLFDGDKAGIAATERAMEIGLEHGMVLYGASLPDELDPDELLIDPEKGTVSAEGTEKMRALLDGARPLLDARTEEEAKKALIGPEERTQALRKVATWLSKFKDPVGKGVRLQALQSQLGVTPQLLERALAEAGSGRGSAHGTSGGSSSGPPELNQGTRAPQHSAPRQGQAPHGASSQNRGQHAAQRSGQRPGAPRSAAKGQKLSPLEKILLTALAKGGKYAERVFAAGSNLPPKMTISDIFDYFPAREWVAQVVNAPEQIEHLQKNPEALMEGGLDAQVRSILTEAWVAGDPSWNDSELRLAIDRGVAISWARFSQRIKAALAEAEANKDAGLHAQLLKEYLDVQRKMKEFISFYDEA